MFSRLAKMESQIEGPVKEKSKDKLFAGLGFIVAFLALRYGELWLLWAGILFLFLCGLEYARIHFIGYWRWTAMTIALADLVYFGFYMSSSTRFFEEMPGMSLHAVIRITSRSITSRQYIADFGTQENGEISVYFAPDDIFTLCVKDRTGETYGLKVPMGQRIPINKLIYLECDVGLGRNRTVMRISVNGNEITGEEWPCRLNLGEINRRRGTSGSDISHPYSACFSLAELLMYSTTLANVDREILNEYIADRYNLPVRKNRFLHTIGVFKSLRPPFRSAF